MTQVESQWAKLEVELDDSDVNVTDGQWYIRFAISGDTAEADGRIHIGAGSIDISRAEIHMQTRLTIPQAQALKSILEELIAQASA